MITSQAAEKTKFQNAKRQYTTFQYNTASLGTCHLNWDGSTDGRVNDGGGVSHDTATLPVPEGVDESPDRPLHDGSQAESHKA